MLQHSTRTAALCGVLIAAASARAAAPVLRLRAADATLPAGVQVAPVTSAGVRPPPMVIQLEGPASPAQRNDLAAAGVRLLAYLPDHAYLAAIPSGDAARVRALPFVHAVSTFQPSWKIAPELISLRDALARGVRPETMLVDRPTDAVRRLDDRDVPLAQSGRAALSVTSVPEVSAAELATALRTVPGVEITGSAALGSAATATIVAPLARLEGLAALAEVQFIEDAPRATLRNDLTVTVVQSDTNIGTPVWNGGIHGEGQIIGLIDGPPYLSHCMFSDVVPVGPTHRKFVAYRAAPGSGINSHGTHVSGTLAGDSGTYIAYDKYDGVAYAARISFSNYFEVAATPDTFISRLNDAHADGARVHSNSWGDDRFRSYTLWCAQADQFSFDNEDDLLMFAVSNGSLVTTPENAKDVLAVGGTMRYPNQNTRLFGGSGPTADNRRRPEICAPGESVRSAAAFTACETTTSSGTSHACPAVSGSAALVRQYFLDGYYPTGTAHGSAGFSPTGALVKAVLLNSATDMTNVTGYPSNTEGWGRVILDRALYFAGDARRLIVHDVRHADGVGWGDTQSFGFTVTSTAEPLRVTMVFTDPPATIGAADPVINNLDLVVIGPDDGITGSATFRGNYFKNNQSMAGGLADSRNNTEQVYLPVPRLGAYTVEVRGTQLNGLVTQGYAVAVSGAVSPATAAHAGFGDADLDGDVDLADFARVQRCYGGDGQAFADSSCTALDFDGDGDVDSADFAAFGVQLFGPAGD